MELIKIIIAFSPSSFDLFYQSVHVSFFSLLLLILMYFVDCKFVVQIVNMHRHKSLVLCLHKKNFCDCDAHKEGKV